jgi:hypothetical protein
MKINPTSAHLRSALDRKETGRHEKIVHFIASSTGYLPVDPPRLAYEVSCPFCGCEEFYLWMVDSERRAWFCERICVGSTLPKESGSMVVPPQSFRAILWPIWCQINGIGDSNHDVTFETIHQNADRVSFMLKFCSAPRGILLMQGTQGAGKTYAALGMCELFTRKNTSCIFGTQKQIFDRWSSSYRENCNSEYGRQMREVSFLVIDDFGVGESTAPFMTFIMDLINTRMQWKSRGTIITTNIDDDRMLKLTSPAFVDRVNTGQKFIFKEKSRRKPTVL